MSLSVLSVASRLMQEELFLVFNYPVWWYSDGFRAVLRWAHDGLRYRWRKYALGLWLGHLTTPMYGEYSIWGRVVSFVMRVVVIVARLIAWCVEVLVYALLLVSWLTWPMACVLGLILVYV